MALEIKSNPSFVSSIFSKKILEAHETLSNGSEITLPTNMTQAEYIRRVYDPRDLLGVQLPFPFLDRDNKERTYVPENDDPFVFSGFKSVSTFKARSLQLLQLATSQWKLLGLPTIKDTDRDNIEIPDTDAVINKVFLSDKPDPKLTQLFLDKYDTLCNIVSDVDIFKKTSVVRTVLHGWWIVSYKGKNAPDLKAFARGMKVLTNVMNIIKSHPKFKSTLDEIIADQGDPLPTGSGFPYYAAIVDKAGNPVTKITLVNDYAGIGKLPMDWATRLKFISEHTTVKELRKYPLAVSVIRRNQPGYKVQHVWKITSRGLLLQNDQRGHTTNRVAWNASYLHNLLLSPVQSELKAFRKLIPGLTFNADDRINVLSFIRKSKPYMIESDYSNYDRTIPNDLLSWFFKIYADTTSNPSYYFDLLSSTHKNIPIIWPENAHGYRHRGWVFTADTLGLLSGLKITSEVGTFCNLIIMIQSILDSNIMTESELTTYLTSKLRDNNAIDYAFLIQSDDTLLLHKNLESLRSFTKAFVATSKKAGVKGKIELGDRFLMRHMHNGIDTPLSSRIWQNSVSNESPYLDPLKFTVGMAMRSDGMCGCKTFDPFNTGKLNVFSDYDKIMGLQICDGLLELCSSAKHPVNPAIHYLTLLKSAIQSSTKRHAGYWRIRQFDADALDAYRKRVLRALAERELASATQPFIDELLKNRASPSAGLMLEQLELADNEVSSYISKVSAKEHNFYVYAMKTLGLSMYT